MPNKFRKQLLDSPLDILPLDDETISNLASMRFDTVRESFRAALAGRLTAHSADQLPIENQILKAACRVLGHPVIDRETLNHFQPGADARTIADAIAVINGAPFTVPEPLLTASIRELLLPLPYHQAAEQFHATTIGDLLALPLELLPTASITERLLGPFIVHLFDFLFLVNEPTSGTPTPSLAETDLDLAARLLLAPWFTMATLHAGQELLDRGDLKNILIQQRAAGGLFTEDNKSSQVLIRFTDSPSSPSGFNIDQANCLKCGPTPDQRSLCHHAAALALAMLTPDPHQSQQLRPRPFLFPNSPWQLAADILFDLYGAHPPTDIAIKRENDHWRLTADTDFRSVSWRLTDHEMKECAVLFGARLPKKKKPAKTKAVIELRQLYINLTKLATPTDLEDEELLSPPNTVPKRAASFWGWLATSFSLALEKPRFRLEGPADNTLFSLTAHDAAKNVIFALALPRARTPDVLDGLCQLGIAETAEKLPAITRAVLDDNTDLHIESCLRCPDGTVISRTELEPHRYGRYYHLTGKGFVAVAEQTSDNTLSETQLDITTIESDNVPEFIKTHQQALNADENEIAPDLKQLSVKSMPDSLTIAHSRMDDDWCYLAGSYGFGNDKISLEELLLARRQGKKFAATANKWLKLDDGPLTWLHDLKEDRIWNDENGVPKGVRLSKPELLMLSSLIGDVKTTETENDEVCAFSSLLDTDAWLDPRKLPITPEHLRDYQRNGLAWLFNLYQYRMGGILADDMGLGKTHQALALLQAVQMEKKNGCRFLVVCPATVVSHWVEKTRSFYPDIDYHVYHGINRDIAEAKDNSLIITTYGIVRRDAGLMGKLDFDTIILDEVQHLKNKKTEMYKAACRLNGRVTIGLTGTPLENSTNDLKAIFDLCLPGLLGTDATFNKHYALPIEERNDKKQRDRLARLIQPFLLRRAKPQVLKELPDVIEDIRTCELSEDQVTLYREIVEQRGRALISGFDDASGKKPAYMEVLAVISYLKQICDHPALLADPKEKRTYRSGKWDLFVELLDECLASGMKVVVFSHYTRMLDLIEAHLDRRKIGYCSLRGNMQLKKRETMISRFNSDPESKVFCASLLAGGVGVDLTAAQAVIHYDRWWNAAREDQATSRVHRMGQRHVVLTFKLITTGTLEEKIHQIIERKRNLAQHLVREDDDAVIKRLSRDELLELLQWDSPR